MREFLMAIVAWFPKEVILALSSIVVAAGIDAGLTALLALRGKLGVPFSWKKLPEFLVTNVLWPAVGLLVGGALVKYYPDLTEGYFAVTAALDLWLAKDWRAKFNVLVGIRLPETLLNKPVVTTVVNVKDASEAPKDAITKAREAFRRGIQAGGDKPPTA